MCALQFPHSCTSITEKRRVLLSSRLGCIRNVRVKLLPWEYGHAFSVFSCQAFSLFHSLSLSFPVSISESQGNSEENRSTNRHHDIVYTEDTLSLLSGSCVFSWCGGNPRSWSFPLPPFLTSLKVRQNGAGGDCWKGGSEGGTAAAAVAMVTPGSHQWLFGLMGY